MTAAQKEAFPMAGCRSAGGSAPIKKGSTVNATLWNGAGVGQPFGSMPRCCSSFRMIRFIHAANDSSPSCRCASSIAVLSSASNRNWKGWLPRRAPFCVDIIMTPNYHIYVSLHVTSKVMIKQRPVVLPTHTGRLTKPLIEVAIMAVKQHTTPQTGRDSLTPNFIWRFLALSRTDRAAKPCRMSVEAKTEREARCVLAPYFILSFAARLPVQGVRHV